MNKNIFFVLVGLLITQLSGMTIKAGSYETGLSHFERVEGALIGACFGKGN